MRWAERQERPGSESDRVFTTQGSREVNSFEAGITRFAERSLAQSAAQDGDVANSRPHVEQVRAHQLEVFVQTFPCWIAVFSLVSILGTFISIVLFFGLLVALGMEMNVDCDAPLRLWSFVEFVNTVYGVVHVLLMQWCCSDEQGLPQEDEAVARARARRHCARQVYASVMMLYEFVWQAMGLYWVQTSATCKEESPKLYVAVTVYPAFCIVFNIVVAINTVGLLTILMWMLRHGLLSSEDAAPSGTVEKLELIEYGSPELQALLPEHSECSICLGAFKESAPDVENGQPRMEIRRTPCGHVFHTKCLGNWLQLKRACPLCREDIVSAIATKSPKSSRGHPASFDEVMQRVIIGHPQAR
eukprot:TRINITY_DN41307_c0_g1_i1.p1 TRINITY_DN41307_c0_g1~~TRINITY_DN41307_c0_g1_i1.p1  ORF type:complete len:359 (+),score=79.29 TRINITY_DN41307_c0_g1_i1:73-1149(+)